HNPKRRKPLADEIAETCALDQHESISLTISMLRSLYMHVLLAMRDGDYTNPSSYISDLIRRDKHVHNQKPDHLIAIPAVGPPPEKPKLGFSEKEGTPVMG